MTGTVASGKLIEMRLGQNSRDTHKTASGVVVLTILLMNVAIAQDSAKPISLPPMPASADPAFEVATIKPSDTAAAHGMFLRTEGRHSIAYNFSVKDLICFVYGVHETQIVDGPKALLETRFDIDGVSDIDGRPNIEQRKIMYRKLLESRFNLSFHRDKRQLPAYEIVQAKDGAKLTKTDRQPGDGTVFSYDREVVLKVRNASMSDFAHGMQEAILDKPVVDETGLRDRYDFDLKWSPDEGQLSTDAGAESRHDPNGPPGLYTAIQEQLGLKIESKRAPVEVLVIDHLAEPSPN
jgi:uncharacterized protein (TIGR03435 family)